MINNGTFTVNSLQRSVITIVITRKFKTRKNIKLYLIKDLNRYP